MTTIKRKMDEDSKSHVVKRRGGISFDRTDKNALYVRMLGDVRVRTKPALARERRRSSIPDTVHKIIEPLTNNDITHRNNYCKFVSLHRSSHRRPKIETLSHQSASLLDVDYSGQAQRVLSRINNWDFDVFHLDRLTNGRSLFYVSLYLFHEYNLVEHFKLDMLKLFKCFALIEEGYHCKNPYHNAIHAADVTQAMHCYLKEQLISDMINPLETMATLFAAITHDLDHPGVNQAFLIATSSHLAAMYKNSSVLENHHWRSCIAVIRETGLIDHFTVQQKASLEWHIKSLILATDITRQQEFLTRFQKHLDSRDLNLHNSENRHFILQIALKCADICNPCRKWETSRKWSYRVCEEFFQQGDYERRLNLPITTNCDRSKTTVAKIQAGFIEFVVEPLFRAWGRFLPCKISRAMCKNIKQNKGLWQEILRETVMHGEHSNKKEHQSINQTEADLNSAALSRAKTELRGQSSGTQTRLPPLSKVSRTTNLQNVKNVTSGSSARTYKSNGSARRDAQNITRVPHSTGSYDSGKGKVKPLEAKFSVKPKERSPRGSPEMRVRSERTVYVSPSRASYQRSSTESRSRQSESRMTVHATERKTRVEKKINLEHRTIESKVTVKPQEKSERTIEMKLTVEPPWETLGDNQAAGRSSEECQRSEKFMQSKLTFEKEKPKKKKVPTELMIDPEGSDDVQRTVESKVTIEPIEKSDRAEVSLSMSPSLQRRSETRRHVTSTSSTTRHSYSGDPRLRLGHSPSPSRASSRYSRPDSASSSADSPPNTRQSSPWRKRETRVSTTYTSRGATSPATQSKFSRSSASTRPSSSSPMQFASRAKEQSKRSTELATTETRSPRGTRRAPQTQPKSKEGKS